MTCPDRPTRPSNRPGLPALRYRIGDYATFRTRLIERLTCAFVTPDLPQGISLRQLNTRTEDDPAIALLDACAVVADVLTFYQERIINEGYLLTATERRSVLELARMIGYELNPGVAASTLLAFTVEETPDAPKTAAIAKGTAVLSIPEQDELPQTFETSADFTAHVEWNALKPRHARPQTITETTRQLFLKGTNTGLQPGDPLLLMDGASASASTSASASKPHYLLTIDRVEPNSQNGYTIVSWQPLNLTQPPRHPQAIAFRQKANLFGFNAPRWETVSDEIKLTTGSRIKGGVYRTSDGISEPHWQSVNAGLLSFDIRCLTVTPSGVLLVGTPIGVFQSKDNGNTWALANAGLTNFNIQTIFATTDQVLVGTPGGGVFRSTDDGETWSPIGMGSITVITTTSESDGTQTSQPINTGIPNAVVRAIATIDFTFTLPRLSATNIPPAPSDPPREPTEARVQITRGERILPLSLQVGDVIVVDGQSRSVKTVNPVDLTDPNSPVEVVVDSFRNPPTAESLTGTPRDVPAGTAFVAYRPSSATAVAPLLLASSGDRYILAATDVGVYRSNDQGTNWYGSNNPDHQPIHRLTVASGLVFASTDRSIYQSNDQGATWLSTNLSNTATALRSLVAFGNDAFVAASDGVWRSRSGGNWVVIVNGLTDTNVWSIAINSANGDLFALTESGIFQSENQGDTWSRWSDALPNPDLSTVSAWAKSGIENQRFLFAGTAFTGFEKVGAAGWANFQIPTPQPGESSQIDLSTTYPKLLADSWLVLRSSDRYQLCQIQAVAEVQRRDFTLDAKIARVFTDTLIGEPETFDLREAIVLAQSEELPLMDEPLTVAIQQANIFFDPIWANKVLLSQYVSGLQPQHPVIVSGKRMRADLLNAGGIVQAIPNSNSSDLHWQRTNSSLTNTSATSFAVYAKREAGMLTSLATAIRGTGTQFTQELKVGMTLSVGEQSQKIVAIYSDDSLMVEVALNPALDAPVNFTYSGNGTGTIASQGITFTGSQTVFKQELKEGDTLTVGRQSWSITKIDSDTSLVAAIILDSDVESEAPLDLPPGTPFTYQGEGIGTIADDRTIMRGTDTEFTTALQMGQSITINDRTYRIQQIISKDLLFVDAEIDVVRAAFRSNTLFLGTAGGGVFRSIDHGDTWEAINQGLTTLSIQAIAVQSVQPEANQTKANQDGYQLFVGTEIGVFQTDLVTHTDDNVQWKQVNGNLTYPDIRALLPVQINLGDRTGCLLAGTVNGGVLLLVKEGEQSTWIQTGLTNVDVQTLMLTENGEIFAGTIADRVFRGVIRDRDIIWQALETGLTDNPNVTSLVSYRQQGIGKITTNGNNVIGEINAATNLPSTRFTTELAIGDMITIQSETRRVQRVLSDLRLEVESEFSRTSETSGQFNEFEVTRVLAGTPGSGIFRLKPDVAQRPTWSAVANHPADLNVQCLTVAPDGKTLYAGTASGGIFRSIDDGNSWIAINAGLTSLDPQINPAAKVNTEFRAIAFVNQTLFATGIGILISPDYLYMVPIRAGDRLQVMSPPTPLPTKGRETSEPMVEQKWMLSDRDGFLGVVFTTAPTDVQLQPAATEDAPVSEQNAIALPPPDQQQPLLTLANPMQNSYDPQTMKIYANVVPATHGETIQELLGNGDSTLTHQKFELQKPPLTYVSATTPSGAETTLQVRVNQVLWQEVPSLYQRSPLDQVYITRIADDRSVTITLGDGSSGARLPTGIENVTATYRSGIGLAGRVGADRLSLLKTRPLGIAAVTNPLPATGAADPETMAEARTSAPLTVRTLDRIVSLQDYEDFARAFAGIGKAQADLLIAGEAPLVHITVAAVGGRSVLPDTALYTNLVQAIDASRDPVQQVQVTSYESIAFNLEAKLLVDARYLPDRVMAAAKAALIQRFVFENRSFGQAVTAAEAIATLQAIAGMIAVDLDALYRRDRIRSLEQSVPALPARWEPASREILPAQLLVINPAGIRLRVEATQ
jgi:photosystem II stability/assembly factor-like uncharacterized protein/sorbitol-specific phosphotransferase system component IIA